MSSEGTAKRCFVIGPIGKKGSPERKDADWLLHGIIEPVLTNEPFNYEVRRSDQIAEPGLITDQIIGAVIDADLVIADLTGGNPNAFYELAISHMERKAVIHIAKEGESLPFDIKDYRAIIYSREEVTDFEKAQSDLSEQVKAIEDPEYQPSNPITKARGVIELERSGEPIERLLADVVEGQRRLEARWETVIRAGSVLETLAGRSRPPMKGFLSEPVPTTLLGDPDAFSADIAVAEPPDEEEES